MKYFIFTCAVLYLIIINALGFLLMLIDKKKAQKRRHRIPEAVLLTIAAIGGCVGVLAGMEIFRHKTKHPSFYIGIPAIVFVEILVVVGFYYFIIR